MRNWQYYILTEDHFWEDATFALPDGMDPEEGRLVLSRPRKVVLVVSVGEDVDCPREYVREDLLEGR